MSLKSLYASKELLYNAKILFSSPSLWYLNVEKGRRKKKKKTHKDK